MPESLIWKPTPDVMGSPPKPASHMQPRINDIKFCCLCIVLHLSPSLSLTTRMSLAGLFSLSKHQTLSKLSWCSKSLSIEPVSVKGKQHFSALTHSVTFYLKRSHGAALLRPAAFKHCKSFQVPVLRALSIFLREKQNESQRFGKNISLGDHWKVLRSGNFKVFFLPSCHVKDEPTDSKCSRCLISKISTF